MEHLQTYSLSNHTANMSLDFFKYSSFALPPEIKDLKYLSIQLEVLFFFFFLRGIRSAIVEIFSL